MVEGRVGLSIYNPPATSSRAATTIVAIAATSSSTYVDSSRGDGTFWKNRHLWNFQPNFRRSCHAPYHPPLDRGRYREAEKYGPKEAACGHCRRAWSICWGVISE